MDSDNNYFCTAEIPGRFRRVALGKFWFPPFLKLKKKGFFGCTACGILVPQPGKEPTSPELEAQSLNHWPAREVPAFLYLKHKTVI